MNDEVFCRGRAGEWVFAISQIRATDGSVSGTSEIRFQGAVRCRLSLNHQAMGGELLMRMLRAKSVEWIEGAEKDAAESDRIENWARERTDAMGRYVLKSVPSGGEK